MLVRFCAVAGSSWLLRPAFVGWSGGMENGKDPAGPNAQTNGSGLRLLAFESNGCHERLLIEFLARFVG